MNLVFLQYSPNNCYVQVVREKPEDVVIDQGKGVWEWTHADPGFRGPRKIGESRALLCNTEYGTIGVYDPSNVKHLSSMVSAALASQRTRVSYED